MKTVPWIWATVAVKKQLLQHIKSMARVRSSWRALVFVPRSHVRAINLIRLLVKRVVKAAQHSAYPFGRWTLPSQSSRHRCTQILKASDWAANAHLNSYGYSGTLPFKGKVRRKGKGNTLYQRIVTLYPFTLTRTLKWSKVSLWLHPITSLTLFTEKRWKRAHQFKRAHEFILSTIFQCLHNTSIFSKLGLRIIRNRRWKFYHFFNTGLRPGLKIAKMASSWMLLCFNLRLRS